MIYDFVKTRDVDDRFPGATRTAANSQLDHIIAHDQGGPSSSANSQSLSPHTHRAKTFGGFTPHHLGDGVIAWTTPLGRTYTTRPHDYRPDHDDRDRDPGGGGDSGGHQGRDRGPGGHRDSGGDRESGGDRGDGGDPDPPAVA